MMQQYNYATFTQKYKTNLCRHWQTSGNCQIGAKCHFAHGQEELRNPNDPIKDPTVIANVLTNPIQIQSYKSIRCKYNDIGACRYGQACYFSHGEPQVPSSSSQIQQQQLLLAQQYQELLAQQQQLQSQGGSSASSQGSFASASTQGNSQVQQQQMQQNTSYQLSPEQKKNITIAQLQHMLYEMNKMKLQPEHATMVNRASEILQAQNIPGCSQLLNEIINRPECPLDEKRQFETIINDAQQLALNLMQQFQMQSQLEAEEARKQLSQQLQQS
ncbi:hypothetical protein ABPG74_014895 [Tetrahymena malaccensis]